MEEEGPTLPAPGGRGKGLYACEYALLARLAVLTAAARIALLHGDAQARRFCFLPPVPRISPVLCVCCACAHDLMTCRCDTRSSIAAAHGCCLAHTSVVRI